MDRLHVVIVYRSLDLVPRAIAWCEARRYVVEGIVQMDRYQDAVHVVAEGRAQVIVAASADSLDPNRLPRVEIVDEGDEESGSSE